MKSCAVMNFLRKARGGTSAFWRARLRDTVFGLQDGMVSTLGALTGIAAGSQSREPVVLAGCVIVAVESLSMAAGSYLSSKAQKEYLLGLLKNEKESIERDPEGERRELRAMYAARGFAPREIAVIEERLFSDKALLLEDMAHKELGIVPAALEEPAGNALAMGLSYIAGGVLPVLPYLLLPLPAALPVSIIGTLAALFGVGGWKGRLVRRSWWRSGAEMLAVAGLAAAVGYVIGQSVAG